MKKEFLQLLRCPLCAAHFDYTTTKTLKCVGCSEVYTIENDVPILWGEGSRGSRLEHINYEAMQPITPATVSYIGQQWKSVMDEVCHQPADVLEIGAGPGVLTEGLLAHANLRSIVVTDVSRKFVLGLADRLRSNPIFKGAVVHDANDPVFVSDSFDLVLGRSVLHHLLDYHLVLKSIRTLLKPGGAAIFFEPLLEGKSLVSLACALILQADKSNVTPHLNAKDTQTIRKLLKHQTKHAWFPQTRTKLAELEDKYIFAIDDMRVLAAEIGFGDFVFLDRQRADPTYWSYIQNTLRMVGIDIKKIQHYSWIGDAIRDSYFCESNKIPSPMGFFVFRR